MPTRIFPAGRLLGTLCCLVLATVPALAQSPGVQITPNYRGADLRQIIEVVGELTGRTLIVDPRVQAQVTLYSSTPMTADAFYQTFLYILQAHGYVAIELGNNVVQVMPDANARLFAGAEQGTGGAIVTRVLQVRHTQADQLVAALRPLIASYGLLTSHTGSNTLIITDRADNVDRIQAIVESIDRVGQTGVEIIPLQHARASTVAALLVQMMPAGASGRAPVVTAYEPTNSILFSGSEQQRVELRTLLAHMDIPGAQADGARVHYLAYANAESVAAALQQQFGSANGVTIGADVQTNALLIQAPPYDMSAILQMVQRLDIRRAQISVEAIIVEVSSDRSADLGVTWAVDASSNGIVGLTNFPNLGAGILQLGLPLLTGQTPSPALFPEGLGLGIGRITDNGVSFAGLLRALQGDSRINVISTPIQITLDNEQAEIKVGQQVPFLTGSFTQPGQGGGQPTNPFQTIQREDVGTLMNITPQINRDGTVTLRIQLEISSIATTPAGAVDLVTSIREINTVVIVENGGIVVLGGLIDEVVREREYKVPGLGDLPLIGGLFRSRQTVIEKTNLMVFIRPVILLDGNSVAQYTQEKYTFMRDLQLNLDPPALIPGAQQPVLPVLDLRLTPAGPGY